MSRGFWTYILPPLTAHDMHNQDVYKILDEDKCSKTYGGTDVGSVEQIPLETNKDTDLVLMTSSNDDITQRNGYMEKGGAQKTTEVFDYRRDRKASVTNILENGHVVSKISSPQ